MTPEDMIMVAARAEREGHSMSEVALLAAAAMDCEFFYDEADAIAGGALEARPAIQKMKDRGELDEFSGRLFGTVQGKKIAKLYFHESE